MPSQLLKIKETIFKESPLFEHRHAKPHTGVCWNVIVLYLTIVLGAMPSFAWAGSMYLPMQMSSEIEARVEKLFVVANMPIIKRPIPIKHVQEAVQKAEKTHPALAASIRHYLDRYSHRAGIHHLSVQASAFDGERSAAGINQRGIDQDSNYLVSASAYWIMNRYMAVNVGGYAGERNGALKDEFPEGSFLSLGWDYLQADIGYRQHWLGPFQESDMLISTQASAMPGLTLSNVVPLPWFGIQYELFAQQMSESDQILSEDRSERLTGNPLLAGFHLSFVPVEGFAIGFNRLMQFGGADRDKSVSSFVNAFFNVKDSENINRTGNDFGNQLSSITTRYTFSGEFPMSVYMEYAGEDTSRSSAVHLGNTALMFGIHLPEITKRLDLTWETAEWQNGWYTNGNYLDGLTHYRSILGHWGATQRSEASGAKAQTLKGIWSIAHGKSLSFKVYTLKNVDPNGVVTGESESYSAEYAQGLDKYIVGLGYETGNNFVGESYNKISGFIRW